MKKNLPILITFLVIGLALTQLILTHHLATTGEIIRELEIEASRLEKKNELIEQDVTQLGSLRRISKEAEKLGFVRQSGFLHLTPEVPVAMNY